MWLFTKRGFYSIVGDKLKEGHWQIRARALKDMRNLVDIVKYQGEIIRTPKADYLYRIVVDANQLMIIMTTLSQDINYTNFKDEIKHTPDQKDKLDILHPIWSDMFQYQMDQEKKESKPKRRKEKAKLRYVTTAEGKMIQTAF